MLDRKGNAVHTPVRMVASPKVRLSDLWKPPTNTRVPRTKQKIVATAEAIE
jgi:hypothetical protein